MSARVVTTEAPVDLATRLQPAQCLSAQHEQYSAAATEMFHCVEKKRLILETAQHCVPYMICVHSLTQLIAADESKEHKSTVRTTKQHGVSAHFMLQCKPIFIGLALGMIMLFLTDSPQPGQRYALPSQE